MTTIQELLVMLVIAALIVLIVFKYNEHKKCDRAVDVYAFMSNISMCSLGYLYYCVVNNAPVIEILPSNNTMHDRICEIMIQSKKPLTLENWFDKEQIGAINIGNDILTQLKEEGKLNNIDDIQQLIEKAICDETDKAIEKLNNDEHTS